MTTTAARLERAFTPATPCGQVSNGIACDTPRKGVEKLCPDCNPWRPGFDAVLFPVSMVQFVAADDTEGGAT